MFEKRKINKLAKAKALELAATKQAQEAVSSQSSKDGTRYARNVDALSRLATWKNDIRENLGWVILGSILIIISYFLVGIEFIIPLGLIGALLVRTIVMKFHHPSYQWLLLIKIRKEESAYIRWIGVPSKLFAFIDLQGMANTVMTDTYGPVFLIRDIEFGPAGIPVRIKFAWIHFPEFQFVLKKEVYASLIEYLNKLVYADYLLQETMEFSSTSKAKDMTAERMANVSRAKTESPIAIKRMQEEASKKLVTIMEDLDLIEKRSVEDDSEAGEGIVTE